MSAWTALGARSDDWAAFVALSGRRQKFAEAGVCEWQLLHSNSAGYSSRAQQSASDK